MCIPTVLAIPASALGRERVFPLTPKNASAHTGEDVRQAKTLPCAGDRKTVDNQSRADPMKTKRKTLAPQQAAKKPAKKLTKKAAKKTVKKTPKRASKRTLPRADKEIVQFAPNFTAYVLPPATICLYSEHRKFFLHGELYVSI